MNKKQAEALVNKLQNGLLQVEEALNDIISTKAWEPLGYTSFAEMWEDRITPLGLNITREIRGEVIYAMFDNGDSVEDISDAVKGVSESTVKAMKQAKGQGVSAKNSEAHVRAMNRKPVKVKSFDRNLPMQRNSIHLEGFKEEELDDWKKYAASTGQVYPEMLKQAVRIGMTNIKQLVVPDAD